jgi:nitrogen fixation NifU-like protein
MLSQMQARLRTNSPFAILVPMFSHQVLDHFQNPRNAGELHNATVTIEVTNPVCGDVLRLFVITENGRITQAQFLCKGCTTAIACSSLLTEELKGKSKEDVLTITAEFLSTTLGNLSPATYHGAQLVADAAKQLSVQLK